MIIRHSAYPLKKRRGLSSIVGALLFVVLMVAAFAVMAVALNSQTEIVQTSRDVTDFGVARNAEDFELTSISQSAGSFLDVNLINQGPNAAEMFTMVMTNKSAAGQPTRTFEIPSSTSFLAPGAETPTDIVDTLNINMTIPGPGIIESYDFKVISSLGTIKKLSVECNGDTGTCGPVVGPVGVGALDSDLFLDGPTAVNGKTTTVIMFIQNTGDESVYDVEPKYDCAIMAVQTVGVGGSFSPCALTPAPPIPELAAGAIAIFKWDATVLCEIDDEFTMTNGVKGNDSPGGSPVTPSADDVDSVICIDPNDCGPGGCGTGGGDSAESIILIDDLLIRPSIFMIIPSPMGEADAADKVMYGVNVVNPTNATISVNKVIISVYAPGANNNDKLFWTTGSGCEPIALDSFTGPNDWSCPGENQLMWKKSTKAVELPPYSNETFMAKFRTNGISSACCDVEGVLIQTSVFTTFGSFGKGNYQTTMSTVKAPVMSLYMSPVVDSLADGDRQAFRGNINYTDPQDFNIVLADTDTDSDTWLQSNANFIVNVPRLWEGVNVTGTSGIIVNSTQPTVTIHGDGSTQIIGITNSTIGKCLAEPCPAGEVVASTISFEAIPPSRDYDRLYVMYVLSDGLGRTEGGYDFSSGPLNEIILKVNSNSTGP